MLTISNLRRLPLALALALVGASTLVTAAVAAPPTKETGRRRTPLVKEIDKASPDLTKWRIGAPRIAEVGMHQGRRATQFRVAVVAPTRESLPTDPATLKVSSGGEGGADRITENVTLNFASVEVRYEQRREAPPKAAAYEVTATRKLSGRKKAAPQSCVVEFVPGKSCETKAGDTVEVLPGVKAGEILLRYAHLERGAPGKGVPVTEGIDLQVAARKGSPRPPRAIIDRTYWYTGSSRNRPRNEHHDHVGSYNFMVEISGVNAGAYKASSEMKDQYGEILIDGIEFEFE